jgi:hypothetical protein
MLRLARHLGPCLLASTLVQGCSWMAVTSRADARVHPAGPVCTESVAAPVIDTVAATAYAALAIVSVIGLGQQGGDCAQGDFCPDLDFTPLYVTTAVGGTIGAAAHGVSAAYGYSATAGCREANERAGKY